MQFRPCFQIRLNHGNNPTRNLPGNAAWNGQSMRVSKQSHPDWPECETHGAVQSVRSLLPRPAPPELVPGLGFHG